MLFSSVIQVEGASRRWWYTGHSVSPALCLAFARLSTRIEERRDARLLDLEAVVT